METLPLPLTGRRALVINFTCDVRHMPTSFLQTAIIGMNVCVAGRLTLPDYLWTMKATLDSYIHVASLFMKESPKIRVKVSYTKLKLYKCA